MYCKKCGKQIDYDATFCKHCGTAVAEAPNASKKKKKKMPLILRIFCIFIILITALLCAIIVSSMGEPTTTSNDGSTTENTTQAEDDKLVLVDNGIIKVTYTEVFEESSVGAFYLKMHVENKTDREVWVYLDSGMVNNEALLITSGIPMAIPAGASSNNPFIFTFSQLSISQLSEVESISFNVVVEDNETSETLLTSDQVTITLE